MKICHWLLLIIMIVAISACSKDTEASADGNPEAGKMLFQQGPGGGVPACSKCHSIEPGKLVIGPSLAGIATRAGERKTGMTAEAYLRESILEPNAYVVDGFPKGAMYQKFKDALSTDQINDLVAFLLTLN